MNDRRRRIIYLTDNINAVADLSSETERMIWEGLHAACAEKDCDLLAVLRGGLQYSFGGKVYDLIRPEIADGFVSWITSYVPPNDYFFSRFDNSPMVCITMGYGHHPVVQISSRFGVEALMHHLIDYHGYTKFAFVHGPGWHPYVSERFESWRQVMLERGLDCSDHRVSPHGPWDRKTGQHGVSVLLDERGLVPGRDIEALVCASDRVALGVLSELARRNIRVPQDIAVVGYDNIQEAQSHRPSLTTVSQPFNVQTRHAVQTLLSMIDGCEAPEHPVMITRLVLNESCGCPNRHLKVVNDDYPKTDQDLLSEIIIRLSLLRTPSHNDSAGVLNALYHDLFKEINEPRFVSAFINLIRLKSLDYMDQLHWQDIVSLMRNHLDNHDVGDEIREKIGNVLDGLRVAIDDLFVRFQTEYRVDEKRHQELFRTINTRLAFCTNIPSIWDLLAEQVVEFDIPGIWVSLYENESDPKHVSENSILHLAIIDGIRRKLPASGLKYPSHKIIPDDYAVSKERQILVLRPLEYGERDFGFVVFKMGPDDGSIYQVLANAISAALMSISLRTELVSRSDLLERSLGELRQTQGKLVESEKLAALGELVAGVAHELNTPVGIGLTSSSFIIDKSNVLGTALDTKDCQFAQKALEAIIEGASMILSNMIRATELIEQFKLLSMSESVIDPREFNISAQLEELSSSVKNKLNAINVRLEIDCSPDLFLFGQAVSFMSIMTNLVNNSIIHAFAGREHGLINIQCRKNEREIIITYEDDGIGMEAAVLSRMFEPFFSTKKGKGGTGLGMHIVHNIVYKQFGGMIECRSFIGKGVLFTLHFPIVKK
jgi:DNA-binding LacI/PurR family transcriptional regulator/signal transduction histidine kinase